MLNQFEGSRRMQALGVKGRHTAIDESPMLDFTFSSLATFLSFGNLDTGYPQLSDSMARCQAVHVVDLVTS
jgi:hypothetical protein